MFNVATVCESVRRHWLPIAVIVALSFCAGVGSSFVGKGEISVAPSYTAEASLYVTSYGYQDGSEVKDAYNYSLNDSLAITEMRRVVASDAVAGEVRREFGEDVLVSSPYWVEESTNSNYVERFIFVDVVADDPDVALAAVERASDLTVEKALELLPVSEVVVSDGPYLKTNGSAEAADWGADAFFDSDQQDTVANVASGISVKSVVIYVFVGVVLSVFCFAAYDILSRRIRSSRDLERLLDVPVVAELHDAGESSGLAESLRVLAARFDIGELAVAGVCDSDGAADLVAGLASSDALPALKAFSLADDPAAVGSLASSDAVLLVVRSAAAKGSQIESALKLLKVANTPVLGAVFILKR